MSTAYTPDRSTIAAEIAEVQATWSPAERESRLSGGADAMIELAAIILRPMAIEAGLTSDFRGGDSTPTPPI